MIPLSIGLLAQDNSAEIQFDIDPDVAEAAAGAALGFGLMFVAIWLLVGLLVLVGIWKTFAKAGQPGWASIIPIYNMIVMLEIAGKPLWWFVLLLIPGLNLIAAILIYVSLAERFGRPLVSTSANVSGGPALTVQEEVERHFAAEVDYVLSGQVMNPGVPSTIHEIGGRILR